MVRLITKVPRGSNVPKIIHQTYRAQPWPEEISQNVLKLRSLNEDWEYRFYDDDMMEAFIINEYGNSILSHYKLIDNRYGAAKADLFRYLLMYKCGGVYLDIKSTATRPLSYVIKENDVFLLSHWNNNPGETFDNWGKHAELTKAGVKEIQQWHIICAPGHPFLKATIEYVLRNLRCYSPAFHRYGKHATLRITGPIAYSLATSPLVSRNQFRFIDATEVGLRYSIYDNDKSSTHVSVLKSHYSKHHDVPLTRIGYCKSVLVTLKSIRKRLVDFKQGRR